MDPILDRMAFYTQDLYLQICNGIPVQDLLLNFQGG